MTLQERHALLAAIVAQMRADASRLLPTAKWRVAQVRLVSLAESRLAEAGRLMVELERNARGLGTRPAWLPDNGAERILTELERHLLPGEVKEGA